MNESSATRAPSQLYVRLQAGATRVMEKVSAETILSDDIVRGLKPSVRAKVDEERKKIANRFCAIVAEDFLALCKQRRVSERLRRLDDALHAKPESLRKNPRPAHAVQSPLEIMEIQERRVKRARISQMKEELQRAEERIVATDVQLEGLKAETTQVLKSIEGDLLKPMKSALSKLHNRDV